MLLQGGSGNRQALRDRRQLRLRSEAPLVSLGDFAQCFAVLLFELTQPFLIKMSAGLVAVDLCL